MVLNILMQIKFLPALGPKVRELMEKKGEVKYNYPLWPAKRIRLDHCVASHFWSKEMVLICMNM